MIELYMRINLKHGQSEFFDKYILQILFGGIDTNFRSFFIEHLRAVTWKQASKHVPWDKKTDFLSANLWLVITAVLFTLGVLVPVKFETLSSKDY